MSIFLKHFQIKIIKIRFNTANQNQYVFHQKRCMTSSYSLIIHLFHSYTFTFTGDENHIRTKEYGIGIVDIENNAICLVVVPESSVGMKYESEEGYDIFPEAGIYTSIFSVALLLQAANPEIDSSNFAIDDFTISLSISDYKTLKPEHLAEHNHNDLYHTKDVTNAKVNGVKNYVDGMYDITLGDTVMFTQLATDTEEDYVHATLKNADRDWYGYPPKISNTIPTLEDFANGANYHFAFNPNIASLDISISSDEVKSYNGCLNIRNLFAVITEEYVGVDMMNVDGCTIFEDIVWNDISVEKITFPEAGIYYISSSEALYFVLVEGIPVETIESAESATVSLTIPNYTGFETSKALKPEHIPDTIATKEYVDAAISAAIG